MNAGARRRPANMTFLNENGGIVAIPAAPGRGTAIIVDSRAARD
jgi:hypothetical protein